MNERMKLEYLLSYIYEDENSQVSNWPVYLEYKDIRIYFMAEKEIGSGFNAYVIEYIDGDFSPDSEIIVLLKVIAFFDGIRHMWFYEKDNGYCNYFNVSLWQKIMAALSELEKTYCREPLHYER